MFPSQKLKKPLKVNFGINRVPRLLTLNVEP